MIWDLLLQPRLVVQPPPRSVHILLRATVGRLVRSCEVPERLLVDWEPVLFQVVNCIDRSGRVVHGEAVECSSSEEFFDIHRAGDIGLENARLLHFSRLLGGDWRLKLGLLLYEDGLLGA